MKNKPEPVSAKLYDSQYYKDSNHGYAEYLKNKGIPENLLNHIKNLDLDNKTVLDLGCGRGEFVRYAALAGSIVWGIDYSEESVKISMETISDLENQIRKKVCVKKMDVKKLDFDNNTFDLITGFDIVEHLHDWELKKAVTEFERVLKPGGRILLHTSPNKVMMGCVRTLSKLVGIKLRSEVFHVNEISYFSAIKYFRIFKPKITLEKDTQYWSKQMDFRGKILKKIAKTLDTILDFAPVHFLLSVFPLGIFFSTDIWIDGTKNS